jgi:hypothetical protein
MPDRVRPWSWQRPVQQPWRGPHPCAAVRAPTWSSSRRRQDLSQPHPSAPLRRPAASLPTARGLPAWRLMASRCGTFMQRLTSELTRATHCSAALMAIPVSLPLSHSRAHSASLGPSMSVYPCSRPSTLSCTFASSRASFSCGMRLAPCRASIVHFT